VRLGDTKDSPYWGLHAKWGVVENFDHGTHSKPTYAERCETCHHTNKDAKIELVPKCVSCHKDPGNAETVKNKAGEEIPVEIAYHGNPDNETNLAGCIECHRRYRDNHPDSRAPIKSPCSGCHTEKQASLRPGDLRRPARFEWARFEPGRHAIEAQATAHVASAPESAPPMGFWASLVFFIQMLLI
jgi:hypothetical protein